MILNIIQKPAIIDNSQSDFQEVSVATDKFLGGVDLLSPSKAIAFSVFYPNSEGTPQAQSETYAQVQAILGEKTSVILAIPTESVSSIQQALVYAEAKISYQVLSSLPTRTATPTFTVTPSEATPTVTRTKEPKANHEFFELKVADIASRADQLTIGKQARLVIIEKTMNLSNTPVPGGSTDVCVGINDFLDVKGLRLGKFVTDKVHSILIELPSDRLVEILTSLTRAERIYLLSDSTCSDR